MNIKGILINSFFEEQFNRKKVTAHIVTSTISNVNENKRKYVNERVFNLKCDYAARSRSLVMLRLFVSVVYPC